MKKYLWRILIFLIFLGLWQLSSMGYDSFFFPGPIKVFSSFINIITTPSNYQPIMATFSRVFSTLFIGLVLGTLLGLLPHYSKIAKYVIDTVIYPLLQSVPVISWSFLVAVWLGISNISPIFILLTVITPYFIVNVSEGLEEVNKNLLELGQSYTNNKIKLFKKIIFPSIYPYLFSALRRSLGAAWKAVLITEIFSASSGIGNMINRASQLYDVSQIMGWTLIIVLMVVFFEYGVFRYVDKRTMRKYKAGNEDETKGGF